MQSQLRLYKTAHGNAIYIMVMTGMKLRALPNLAYTNTRGQKVSMMAGLSASKIAPFSIQAWYR